jgi:hypothetical protein
MLSPFKPLPQLPNGLITPLPKYPKYQSIATIVIVVTSLIVVKSVAPIAIGPMENGSGVKRKILK